MQVVLPANLELLSLLHPSSVSVDNLAVTAPRVSNPVLAGDISSMTDEERKAHRERQFNFRMAVRNGGHPSISSKGGRRDPGVSREDVLGALTGISPLHQLFVFGHEGMLREVSMLEFERLVFIAGIERGTTFVDVPMKEFAPVFRLVWHDTFNRCTAAGKPRNDIGTQRGIARGLEVSQAKARRLQAVYADVVELLSGLAIEVSERLRVGIRRAA